MNILILAICCLSLVTATPIPNDQRVIIGYRTMDLVSCAFSMPLLRHHF